MHENYIALIASWTVDINILQTALPTDEMSNGNQTSNRKVDNLLELNQKQGSLNLSAT